VNQESWKKFADDVILAFAEEITLKHIDTQVPTENWAENIRKWFVGENENAGVNEVSWSKFADQIINAFQGKNRRKPYGDAEPDGNMGEECP